MSCAAAVEVEELAVVVDLGVLAMALESLALPGVAGAERVGVRSTRLAEMADEPMRGVRGSAPAPCGVVVAEAAEAALEGADSEIVVSLSWMRKQRTAASVAIIGRTRTTTRVAYVSPTIASDSGGCG